MKAKQILPCPFCEGKGKLFYFPYPGEADCKYCGGTGKMWSFVRNVGDQLLEYLSKIDNPDLRTLLPKLGDVIDEIVEVTRGEGDAGEGLEMEELILRNSCVVCGKPSSCRTGYAYFEDGREVVGVPWCEEHERLLGMYANPVFESPKALQRFRREHPRLYKRDVEGRKVIFLKKLRVGGERRMRSTGFLTC